MTKDEIQLLAEAMKNDAKGTKVTPLVSILIGLVIAIGGNFIGWFANKSTGDIENVTKITQSLEYVRADIQEMKEDIRKRDEDINKKLDAGFTRDEFEREMSFRDQDYTRLKGQLDNLYLELDKRRK